MFPGAKRRATSVRSLSGEVRRLDNQRIALPPATRIAEPLPDLWLGMRTSVQRDYAGIVDHLDKDDNVARALQDLIVVVVEAGHHRSWQPSENATIVRAPVFGPVSRAGLPGRSVLSPSPFLAGRQRRQSAIERVNDQRCPCAEDSPLHQEFVVRAGLFTRTVVQADLCGHFCVTRRKLFGSQDILSGKIFGPLQRGRRRIRPRSLYVRVSPRGWVTATKRRLQATEADRQPWREREP